MCRKGLTVHNLSLVFYRCRPGWRACLLKEDAILLKGHCHTDFAVFWSKYTEYMTNYLCSNVKLLLEHQEDNIK